jgi:DNA mismatch repair protein MutS
VAVKELDNQVIFLRKLVPGGSEHSFGIHVAKMAGMPNDIVIRANDILKQLERDKLGEIQAHENISPPTDTQLTLFESDPRFEQVLKLLNEVDIHVTSPIEALLKLNEIKEILKSP